MTTTVTFVGCDETPPEWAHWVGRELPIYGRLMPTAGFKGRLRGVPGRMLDGARWEICAVDMRDEATRLLDEAEGLLREEPRAGEPVAETWARHVRAQRLILLAQIKVARRMT